MLKVYAGIVIFIAIVTTIVIAANPQLTKSINFLSSSNNIELTESKNIQNKDIKVESKNVSTPKETVAIKPVENLKNTLNTASESVENITTVSRDEYMAQMKERAKQKYAQYLEAHLLGVADSAAQEAKALAEVEKQNVSYTPPKQTVQTVQPQKTVKQKTVTKTAAKKTTTVKKAATTTPKVTKTTRAAKTTQTTKTQSAPKVQQTKTATAAQQSISLERWRNNINTKIISSATPKMSKTIPTGTKYSYSFYVDANRNISDIQVTVVKNSNNAAAKSGINTIKSCIQQYQKNSILQFPSDVSIERAKVAAYITITR